MSDRVAIFILAMTGMLGSFWLSVVSPDKFGSAFLNVSASAIGGLCAIARSKEEKTSSEPPAGSNVEYKSTTTVTGSTTPTEGYAEPDSSTSEIK